MQMPKKKTQILASVKTLLMMSKIVLKWSKNYGVGFPVSMHYTGHKIKINK